MTKVSVQFRNPHRNEEFIESSTIFVWAKSGAHLISLGVTEAPNSALDAILSVAKRALTKCFHPVPKITHSPLPDISAQPIKVKPPELSRASLRAFKTRLCNALGVSVEG